MKEKITIKPNIEFYITTLLLIIGGSLGSLYFLFDSQLKDERFFSLVLFPFAILGFYLLFNSKIITIYMDKEIVNLRYIFRSFSKDFNFSQVVAKKMSSSQNTSFLNPFEQRSSFNRRVTWNTPDLWYQYIKVIIGDKKIYLLDFFYNNTFHLTKIIQ